jgi:outer membrane protein assembly factor BamB
MIRSAFLASVICGSAFAADWPTFLGPIRDGSSPEKGLLAKWPESGPKVLWSKPVGTGYSAPSVIGGMVVLFHRVGDFEVAEAIEASSGKSLWRYESPTKFEDPFGYNNGPRCAPVLTTDRCFLFGAEGALICLNRADGKLVWRRETGKEFDVPEAFFGVGAAPVLDGPRLIVQVGGHPNSNIVAFDAATGKTLWEAGGEKTWNGVLMRKWPGEPYAKWDVAHPGFQKAASYSTPVLATIHGLRHVLVLTRQGLLSLDPETGAHRFSYWFRSFREESVNAMTPVVSGDKVLISSAYYKSGAVLLQVKPDGKSVDEIWASLALEMHWAQPNLVDGFLYGFSGRNEPDGVFRCVEMSTGKIMWERNERWRKAGHGKLRGEPMPDVFARGWGIHVDGKLIALGEAGLLGLFRPDAEKCVEISRWQVPGMVYPTWAGPVLSDGRLFLRSEELLVCVDVMKP